jgi:hypothetical protein
MQTTKKAHQPSMRVQMNTSFTAYEWKEVKKHMEELGLNTYNFFRYCIFKECGIEIEQGKQEGKDNSGFDS